MTAITWPVPQAVKACSRSGLCIATALAAAGLQRVIVSLDSLNDAVFMALNDAGFPVARELDTITAAAAAGLAPVKVNMVVKRGVNEQSPDLRLSPSRCCS